MALQSRNQHDFGIHDSARRSARHEPQARHTAALVVSSSSSSLPRRRRSSRADRSWRPRRRGAGRRDATHRPTSTCWSAVRRCSNVGATIARVSLTVPDIADAMVTAPTQLLIHGKQPGTISLFVWDKRRRDQDLRGQGPPRPDAARRADQAAVPGRADHRHRQRQGRRHLRHGRRASTSIEKAARSRRRLRREEGERRQPAEAAGRRGVEPGDAARALRRSEPQRAAGARRARSSPTATRTSGSAARSDASSSRRPTFDDRQARRHASFSDFLNLFLFNSKEGLGARRQARCRRKGLFQSLAEPNLIATNGKEASFLAGGEYPVSGRRRAAAATPSRSCSRSSASA